MSKFSPWNSGDEIPPMKNSKTKKHLVTSQLKITDPKTIFNWEKPQTPEEWAALSKLKKIDANDIVAEGGREGFIAFLNNTPTYLLSKRETPIISLKRLWALYPEMAQPIIDGLLRRSEIMNIISAPKMRKSYMGLNLAMSIVSGGNFFGRFKCTRGKVLVIDNELQPPVTGSRTKIVSEAMNIPLYYSGNLIDYICCRGDLVDVMGLRKYIEDLRPKYYSLIILDALYKFYPAGFDENSNSDMSRLYAILEMYADAAQAAIVVIHHSSKFSQTGKQVVDVGAGAGSLARACDAHLVVRPMPDDDNIVRIDAVTRSFPPIQPFCATFKYPVWELNPNADPDDMVQDKKTTAVKAAQNRDSIERFLESEIGKPMTIKDIVKLGYTRGFNPWSRSTAYPIILDCVKNGKMRLVDGQAGNRPATYQSASKPNVASTDEQSPDDQELNSDQNIPF